MPEQTSLWRLIEQWRTSQRFNVSQAALAKDIGVSRSVISQWKYGESRPTPANMRALQSATGLRYRDLLDAMLQDLGYLPKEAGHDAAAKTDAGATPANVKHLPPGPEDFGHGVAAQRDDE